MGTTSFVRSASLAEIWATKDLAAAAAWSQGLGDPKAREVAGQAVARHWLKADPEGTQRWALSLSPGFQFRVRAAATQPHIMTVAQLGDTRRAMSLAGEWLSDQEIRRQTIQEIESLTGRYSINQ
jgi:hypothetical protein